MKRRSFLAGILASATAPAVIAKSGILMPVKSIVIPSFDHKGIALTDAQAIRTQQKLKEMIDNSPRDWDNPHSLTKQQIGRGSSSPIYYLDEAAFFKDGKPVYVASPPRGYSVEGSVVWRLATPHSTTITRATSRSLVL